MTKSSASVVTAPWRVWSRREGLKEASEQARAIARGFGDLDDLMRAIALSSEAGWVIATMAARADDQELLRLRRGVIGAVRTIYVDLFGEEVLEEVVHQLERLVGMRDVIARWSSRADSVALWRADGEPIDLVNVDRLGRVSEAAAAWFREPTVGKAREVVRLLREATCRTGCEVAGAVESFAGVAAALTNIGYTPDGIARSLVRARAEAMAALGPQSGQERP
jgi:hypothetical protein